MARGSRTKKTTGPELGYEAQLWKMADALRNNMDAAEYKHVVLGLIFLKYISDAFEAKHAELQAKRAEGADPEDPDEYRAASIFWVPSVVQAQHFRSTRKLNGDFDSGEPRSPLTGEEIQRPLAASLWPKHEVTVLPADRTYRG